MKNLNIVLISALTTFALITGTAYSATNKDISEHGLGDRSVFSERATNERIAPDARVCVKGVKCEKATVAKSKSPAKTSRSGADIAEACAACHGAGNAMGAPASPDEWSARASSQGGLAGLVKSAKAGIPPGMPAMGMCNDCNDKELSSAIEHMMNQGK